MMAEVFKENRFSTFDELLDSDQPYNFFFAPSIDILMNSSLKYRKARGNNFYSYNTTILKAARQKYLIGLLCKNIENSQLRNPSYYANHYLLPEKLLTYLRQVDVNYADPFLSKLQIRMNQVFEAGLPRIWRDWQNLEFRAKRLKENEETPQPLALKDVKQIFLYLIVGHCASLLILLLEIFYHDFIRHFSMRRFLIRLRTRLIRMARRNQVEPE